MKILYKLTSRSRPKQCEIAFDALIANIRHNDYLIVISVDEDDPCLLEYEQIAQFPIAHLQVGKSKSKIDAINRDVDKYKVWDILVNLSDDQIITEPGFDLIILEQAKLFADTDFFLHFRDTNHNPPDALCTLSILGRKYYDRDHYIYHPSYRSFWCDNEAQDVAKMRNRYHYCPTVIFDHEHPSYGKGSTDKLYRNNDRFWNADKNNYIRRKRFNFRP